MATDTQYLDQTDANGVVSRSTRQYGTDSSGNAEATKSTDGNEHTLEASSALLNKITDGANIKTVATDILPVVIKNLEAFAATPIAANITEIDFAKANFDWNRAGFPAAKEAHVYVVFTFPATPSV